MKKFILALLFLILVFIFVLCFIVFVTDDQDACLDSGVCKEGTEYYINDKKILISKETCLEYGKDWIENKKACIMR